MSKTNAVELQFTRAAKMVAAAIDECPILADNSESLMGMALTMLDRDRRHRAKAARLKRRAAELKARVERGDDFLSAPLRVSNGGSFAQILKGANPFADSRLDSNAKDLYDEARKRYEAARQSRERAESGEVSE